MPSMQSAMTILSAMLRRCPVRRRIARRTIPTFIRKPRCRSLPARKVEGGAR
jgi:hypothetical protein